MPLLDSATIDDARAALQQATAADAAAARAIIDAALKANAGDTHAARSILLHALPAAGDPRLLFLGFQFFFRTAVADGPTPDQRAQGLATAEHLVRRRLAIVESAADHPAIARAHTNLGLVLHYQGRMSEAEAHYLRAVEIDQAADTPASPNARGLARSLGNLGNFYESRNTPPSPADLTAAESLYHRAIEHARRAQAGDIAAGLLANLGDIQHAKGDAAAARSLWQQALDLIGDTEHKARANCEQRLRETA